eukprot:6190608-Pleurochrysis_carterae.AAC.2
MGESVNVSTPMQVDARARACACVSVDLSSQRAAWGFKVGEQQQAQSNSQQSLHSSCRIQVPT